MLLHGRTEQRKMLAHQRVGVQIAKALIHGGRTLQVGKQEGHLADPETLPFINTFGAEQAPEGLFRQQHPAGHVRIEVERRLDRLRHDFGRPVDQQQRAAHRSRVFSTSMTTGPGGTCGQRSREALAIVFDPHERRRRRRLAERPARQTRLAS